jgi:arylsulfatase A-like enzyme
MMMMMMMIMMMMPQVWEGGTRTLALVSGYGVGFPGSIRVGLMHVADWVPTLLEAAGAPPTGGASQGLSSVGGPPPYVDSVSAWPMLSRECKRQQPVHFSTRSDVLS